MYLIYLGYGGKKITNKETNTDNKYWESWE